MLRRSKKQKHLSDGTPLLPLPAKHTRMLRGDLIYIYFVYVAEASVANAWPAANIVSTVRWRNNPNGNYKNTSHNEAYIYKCVEIFVLKST